MDNPPDKNAPKATGYLNQDEWAASDWAADEEAGFTFSRDIQEKDVEYSVSLGIPRERAERYAGLRK